jgi:hypothetical protein
MGHSFGCKHGLYGGPEGFKKIAVTVIVEGMFIFPLADGKKNMRFLIVLETLQAQAAGHLGDMLFVSGKYLLEVWYEVRIKGKFYYACQRVLFHFAGLN